MNRSGYSEAGYDGSSFPYNPDNDKDVLSAIAAAGEQASN
jgi:hypothetical protein